MEFETTQLIYFSTITSIVVWVILLYCMYYFISKGRFNKKVKQLEETWEKDEDKTVREAADEYAKDYKQREQHKDKKLDVYLMRYLKKSCFNCKTFDDKAKEDYFCVVDGECPGDDLRKSEKIIILREKDSWLQIIRRE